jgi:hypothetical protein
MKYGVCLMVEQDGAWAPFKHLDGEFDTRPAAETECRRQNTPGAYGEKHVVVACPNPTDILPGCHYRHFKGNIYTVTDLATHSETGEILVIYMDPKQAWARPLPMWVEEVVWPDGQKRPRFCPDSPELQALFNRKG